MPLLKRVRSLIPVLATAMVQTVCGLALLARSHTALVAENLFLRKQLAFYQERQARPRRLTDAARFPLTLWSRLFDWREALVTVKPETLIRWHRKSVRLFWRLKSRAGDFGSRKVFRSSLCSNLIAIKQNLCCAILLSLGQSARRATDCLLANRRPIGLNPPRT